jgi:hypothetical protein
MDTESAARRIRQDFPCLTIARIVPLGEGLGNIALARSLDGDREGRSR